MTTTLIALALAGFMSAADAAEKDDGSFVLVDRAAWLYSGPDSEAARFRPDEVPSAPEHATSPVVVLLRMGPARGGFVPVRIATHEAPRRPDGGLQPPDTAPSSWSHCYVQPPVLAQTRIDGWIRQRDQLPVLTRDVEVGLADGTQIQLSRGLSLVGSGKRYRVRGMHVDMIIDDLPRDAIGDAYTRDRPPAQRLLIAETPDGSFAVQPTWSLQLDAREGTLKTLGVSEEGGEPTIVLRDRCLRIANETGTLRAPRVDETSLRGAATWPITVPTNSPITTHDGQRIGETGAGVILWSRAACSYDTHRGLCCDPLPGASMERFDGGLCFVTDLPDQFAGRSLSRVFEDRSRRMRAKLDSASTLEATVTILDVETTGVLTVDDVRKVLNAEADAFSYCYDRRLPLEPGLSGDVRIRFAVGPDAHARTPRILTDDLNSPTVMDCVALRLELPAFVPQVGQQASIVEATLRFRTLPSSNQHDRSRLMPRPAGLDPIDEATRR